MDTDNPEECKVCIVSYNKTNRRPRTLPCGHTFCSLCIAGMIKKEHLSCPTCRVQHLAPSSAQFPISYDMEAVIRKLKVLQLEKVSSAEPNETRSLIQEREESLRNFAVGLRETLRQLERYETNLIEWRGQHKELLEKIRDLAERNETAVRLLEDEESILLYQHKKGQEKMKKLEALQNSLAEADSAQDAVTAIDDSDHCTSEADDWIQNCSKIFPDVNTLNISNKVREASRRALEIINAESTWDETSHFQLGDSLTIMEKVNHIAPPTSVEILQRLGRPTKSHLEAGHLVAVQEGKNGQFRCSQLDVQNGLVHLHVLRHQTEPPIGQSVEHESLMGLLDASSTLVFLDLDWEGRSSRGRVYIRLSPDTGLGRQFLLLCTGERGPSYASSRLLGVWNRGTQFEMVGVGGDYNCEAGAPLLRELKDCDDYKRPASAGTVKALHPPESNKGAQFSISTRHCPGREWHWAFGQVEIGMNVVKSAAKLRDVGIVAVVDCGVVLPL